MGWKMFAIYRDGEKVVKAYLYSGRWEIVDTDGGFLWARACYSDRMGSLEVVLREFLGENFDNRKLEIVENKA